MELLGFLLAALAIAFVIAKVLFKQQAGPSPNNSRAVSHSAVSEAESWVEKDAESLLDGIPLKGMVFHATFKLTTPLAVLEQQGLLVPQGEPLPKVMPGAGSSEETFGAYGMWSHEIDYEATGFIPPAPSTFWTQLGYYRKNDPEYAELLEFLKGFRRIVESTDDVMEALDHLQDFSRQSQSHQRVWERYTDLFPEFPMHYFAEQLRFNIGGSKKNARCLIDAGYTCPQKVRDASDAELLQVKGIGWITVKRIRERLANPGERFDMD